MAEHPLGLTYIQEGNRHAIFIDSYRMDATLVLLQNRVGNETH